MVVYVGRCKTLEEASEVQTKLIVACSTLVFSRVLTKPRELHMFDAQMLHSGDEQLALGSVTFGKDKTSKYDVWRILAMWLGIMAAVVMISIIAGSRILREQAPSLEALSVLIIGLVASLTTLSYLSFRALNSVTPDRKAFWKAERWLARGYPVLIAGSDLAPENSKNLPHDLIWFVQSQEEKLKRSA